MTAAPALTDPARLHALTSSGLLLPAPDPALDRFTRLAARAVDAPIAQLSLLTGDRQVVKSAAGLPDDDPLRDEIDLADSFCRYAVEAGEPFVVGDAAGHPLVGTTKAVRTLGIRAYIGVPLTDRDGHALGVLCALDRAPRAWSDEDVAALHDLAAAVEGEIELRRARRRAERGAEMQAGGLRVLQMVADGMPLEQVLEELARGVERLEPEWRVAVMLRDQTADDVLRPAATANVHEPLRSEIETIAVAADGRPCGAAAFLGERMIVADMDGPGGVRACWSTPLLSPQREVLGTFTVFRDEAGAPGLGDTRLIDLAAQLGATAIARSRSEQRLAATARRLGEAQAIARIGSWEWERARGRVIWSDYLYEALGFPRGTPPGHDEFLAHVHPDDRAQVSDTIDAAFERGERGYEYECRFVRPDGESITLMVRADIGFDSVGEPVRSSGICQDVTELRRSERELEATTRRLEQAQALAQIGSWEWEAETGRTRWSIQAHRIFGLDPAGPPLSHDEFLARVHPADRERVDRITLDAHLGGEPGYEYECRIVRPNGTVRLIHVLGEVTLDEQGRPLRSTGTAQDVTERREALARLAEAESVAQLGSWEWEIAPDLAVWSPQLYRIFGVEPESFTPSFVAVLEHLHPEDRGAVRHAVAELLDGGTERLDVSYRIVRPDGGLRWVRARGEAVRDEHGEAVRLIGTLQDVTEAKRAEASLREAEERFGSTFDESEVGMALLDTRITRLLRVNRALCELLGRGEEELLRMKPADLRHPDEEPIDADELRRRLLAGQRTASGERRYIRADGETVHAAVGITLVADADDQPLYFVIRARDLTDQRRAEEQLRYQALHSALTGLPNRTLLLERLRHALRQAERRASTLAVMAVDLDRFGAVNERFGIAAGDEALAAVGARLASHVRPGDTVAHLGGDEFLVLCEDLPDEREAVALAARLEDVVCEPLTAGDAELRITASIGIALAHEGDASAEDLIRNAESAMSRASERGGASWEVFDPSLRARLVDRLQLEHELRRALEHDELRLHYQPIVGVGGELEVDGAEALVRWEHPERGLLMPADFLCLAEETGLILPIGRWVLHEACRQAVAWGDAVPSIAVNVSARQIDAPGFVDEVAAALRESGIEPARVIIELTETGLMESGSPADKLAGLKALGVRVVLDDFGTGYSSLSHLRSFPVDGLKIDRSFVVDVAGDRQAQQIVEAIVGIGSALDISVVAEGVETEDQLEAVTRLGCDAVQGFLLGRPGAPGEVGSAGWPWPAPRSTTSSPRRAPDSTA